MNDNSIIVHNNEVNIGPYFVKKEKIGNLRSLNAEEGYVESQFREAKNRDGEFVFGGIDDRIKMLKGMPFFDVNKSEIVYL